MAFSKIVLNGTTLIDLTQDTVQTTDVVSPKTFHKANGTSDTGTVASKTSTDVTVSGPNVTIPAGIYSSNVTKSVAQGAAGTPYTIKGTVYNNSVNITPYVANYTGYIEGGTLSGTGTQVTASDLVSGDKSITENGTNIDVANYATVSVNVSGGAIDTKSVSNSSNTATSIDFTGMKGTPKVFFVRCATQMQSSSTTYYYVSNMRYNGTNVNGNAFRMGNTRQVTVVTSGYSYSYSGTTLTISSNGSRTAAPGSFYNGTYELTYVY